MLNRRLVNRIRYNLISGIYERLLSFGTFGQFRRLYRALAEAVAPVPGGTIVEMGCGPASVTSYLLPKVGPSGALIGVDIAEKMVERARRRADREAWTHVRYECGDAGTWRPPTAVDVVVFSLCLTGLPDCAGALEHAFDMLEPGGQLVILDSMPEPDRPFARFLMRLKGPLVGARPTRVPLEFAEDRLLDVRKRHLSLGVYTVLSGRKPRDAA